MIAPPPHTPQPWTEQALCAEIGGDEWFPERGGVAKAAKQVCAQCPVREQCLAYALEHDESFGIWGGLTERQRRQIRRGAA